MLSSARVYRLSTETSDLQCLSDRCLARIRLEWLRSERNVLNVALTELSGNPGGDYGIKMAVSSPSMQKKS